MQQLLRVPNFTVSTDGYGAGTGTGTGTPLRPRRPGPAPRLGRGHRELAQPHRTRRHARAGRLLTRDFSNNIGAEIMGRNTFGPQRGPRIDHAWQGWWG